MLPYEYVKTDETAICTDKKGDIGCNIVFLSRKYYLCASNSTIPHMKKILLLIPILCAIAVSARAQQGELNIYADSIVTVMMRRHTTPIARGAKEVPGFRIQLIQSPNRELVMKRKAAFLALFPTVRTDYSFCEPYHKLKAGAFPNKDECLKWMAENNIKAQFPEALPMYDDHVRTKDLLDYLGIFEEEEK